MSLKLEERRTIEGDMKDVIIEQVLVWSNFGILFAYIIYTWY